MDEIAYVSPKKCVRAQLFRATEPPTSIILFWRFGKFIK